MGTGFGRFKVYIFGIGTLKLNNMMAIIWKHRKKRKLFITDKQGYKGYKNTDDEPAWIQDFCDWAILHKNLTRSHYTEDKETVYFELDGSEQETWSKLWIDWMKLTQPESYRNHIIKCNGENPDPEVPKPKPSYKHFLKVVPKHLKCKPVRVQQDACNDCRSLQINIQAAESSNKATLQQLLKDHNTRACFMYQYNTHLKKLAVKSFKNQNITPETKVGKENSWSTQRHCCTLRLTMMSIDLR